MRGLLPESIRLRDKKTDLLAYYYMGIRRERENLLALTRDCRLADLGLIEPARLRQALETYLAKGPTAGPADFISTFSTELWLRRQG
jgi:asparagine synthase (glutamine-hydrolysing)